MRRSGVIDLDEEFFGLLKEEEIFAFFYISLNLPGDQTAMGLCKISRPKSHDSLSHYISLLFMLDAADAPKCQSIDAHISGINWTEFGQSLVEVVSVVPMPYLSQRAGLYIREVDIYLAGGDLDRSLLEKLVSSLARIAEFKAEEPVFWDDVPEPEELRTGAESSTPKTTASFMDKLKYFWGKHGGSGSRESP
ncbi:MAG: hypothetical protein P4L55_11115 [Syntrophobacteraceae bacterium]|nr:hypothetical protein [Syntrophobacteraceae bacterium]